MKEADQVAGDGIKRTQITAFEVIAVVATEAQVGKVGVTMVLFGVDMVNFMPFDREAIWDQAIFTSIHRTGLDLSTK